MNKLFTLSLLAFYSLNAAEVQLSPISIESTLITEVAQNAQTSADVATALSSSVPSIDMSRRSGIANDVLIRGQKRDNISVEIDGTKVCGACPNRMDPPVSHVVANQIEEIVVIEGPYDVTNFGTMSGGIIIKTKAPTQEPKAELNIGFGAFNYKKFGVSASGGNELIRVLISASTESSDQYRDGDGNTLAQQMKNKAPLPNQLQPRYEDMQAYTKKSILTKAFITTAKNQELRLSYTANRSDDILYANSPMDAISDDSNIYSISYNIAELSDMYKNLNFQFYYSDVDHPMSTEYRNAAMNPMMNKTNHMWTTMQGFKLKNDFLFSSHKVLLGVDVSERTWSGEYSNNLSGASMGKSIDNAITKNIAAFATVENSYGDFSVKVGMRLDSTKISDERASHQDKEFTGINANIFTSYALNKDNSLFIGFGQASRVPDARELYFMKGANTVGNPDLEQTTNHEIDFGYETDNDDFRLKIKGFYSILSNYIYIRANTGVNAFENIDATVYGAELSASYYVNDDITLDLGASYKRGQKENALTGQTNTNLADMAPLRGDIALNYEYANNSMASIAVQASDRWSNFDGDNGEQELAAWAVLNMKVKHAINKKFDFTLGVNNLFDETYAQSNTYADLTLVVAGGGNVMLLNEPGRYIYTNLDFKF